MPINQDSLPKSLLYVGSSTLEHQIICGKALVKKLKENGLMANDRVLDLGCGSGRVAAPLTDYLTGSYEGFDIHKEAIEWCSSSITKEYKNFKFIHSDVYNAVYNKKGVLSASTYVLPYKDNEFDYCFAFSLFTHLLPEDTRNYLCEIRRVIKVGGLCLASFFVSCKNEDFDKNCESKYHYSYDYLINLFTLSGFFVEKFIKGCWDQPSENKEYYQDSFVIRAR